MVPVWQGGQRGAALAASGVRRLTLASAGGSRASLAVLRCPRWDVLDAWRATSGPRLPGLFLLLISTPATASSRTVEPSAATYSGQLGRTVMNGLLVPHSAGLGMPQRWHQACASWGRQGGSAEANDRQILHWETALKIPTAGSRLPISCCVSNSCRLEQLTSTKGRTVSHCGRQTSLPSKNALRVQAAGYPNPHGVLPDPDDAQPVAGDIISLLFDIDVHCASLASRRVPGGI